MRQYDDSSLISQQGLNFVHTYENNSPKDVPTDGIFSPYSISQSNSAYPKNEGKINNINLILNSIIDEDISDENPDEFFGAYLSKHNKEA